MKHLIKKHVQQTGHANNLANFEKLIKFVSDYSTDYNPGKELLKLSSLQIMYETALEHQTAVHTAQSVYTAIITQREAAFNGFEKKVSAIILMLKAHTTSKEVMKDIMTLNRKIKSYRATAKLSESKLQEMAVNEKEVNYHSISQRGYENKVDNFNRLLTYLQTIPDYTPTETEWTLEGLKTYYLSLKAHNTSVKQAINTLGLARILRDRTFYDTETGLVPASWSVKAYVRALNGLHSPLYQMIKGIQFRNK